MSLRAAHDLFRRLTLAAAADGKISGAEKKQRRSQ